MKKHNGMKIINGIVKVNQLLLFIFLVVQKGGVSVTVKNKSDCTAIASFYQRNKDASVELLSRAVIVAK